MEFLIKKRIKRMVTTKYQVTKKLLNPENSIEIQHKGTHPLHSLVSLLGSYHSTLFESYRTTDCLKIQESFGHAQDLPQ